VIILDATGMNLFRMLSVLTKKAVTDSKSSAPFSFWGIPEVYDVGGTQGRSRLQVETPEMVAIKER